VENNTKLTWHTEKRRLGDLIEWDKNPRQLKEHDAEHLKKSLDAFGIADPLIINTDNRIIGGHMRRRIMLKSGYKPDDLVDVRVPERELTEREAEELAIRLNKNTGDWDFDALANNFELDDLENWGFELDELDLDLWASDEPPEDPGAKIDKAEELREKWGVESGQLWQLGDHRLICGDSTDKEVIERLMDGEIAAVFTDPPYGINVVGSNNSQPSQKGRIGGAKCYMDGKPVKPNEYAPVVGDDTTDTAEKFYKLCVELGYKDIIIISAIYAMGICKNNGSIMNFAMAIFAKCLSVINTISKAFILFPFFNVMNLKVFSASTYLAFILISFQNLTLPSPIFPRVAVFIAIVFTHRVISALFRAVFGIQMSIRRIERDSAILADKSCFSSISGTIDRTASHTTGCLSSSISDKLITAYRTFRMMTVMAISTARIIAFKFSTTYNAFMDGMIFSNFSHSLIISHIQRWVDMTGKEPELIV